MDIFREGMTIERVDGTKVELTGAEIGLINRAIHAENGRGSIQFYIDSFDTDYDDPEMLSAAEDMLNDDHYCAEVWDEYIERVTWETGEDEMIAVTDVVKDYMRNRKENNND